MKTNKLLKTLAILLAIAVSTNFAQINWTAPEITISTAAELIEFRDLVNHPTNSRDFLGQTITLANNIALEGDEQNQWIPIGVRIMRENDPAFNTVMLRQFRGTFNGNFNVVKGIYINNINLVVQGLFGEITAEATIKNLGVVNVNINAGSSIGGLVANNRGKIINSFATGNITAHHEIAYGSSGGLVAWTNGTIENSFAIVNITMGNATNLYIGVGNFAGTNTHPSGRVALIRNSYAIGTASAGIHISTGNPLPHVGGLIGHNTAQVISSYYDKETSGLDDPFKGTPKTTAELRQQETFVGWDFDDTWDINPNINRGFPFLRNFNYDFNDNDIGGGDFVAVAEITGVVEQLEFNGIPSDPMMMIGLDGNVLPYNATNRNISWSFVSGTAIAFVLDENLIVASPGTFTVRATILNGLAQGINFEQNFEIVVYCRDNNHTWDEWETTKEPTCVLAGDRERICSICGDKEIQIGGIPALEHDFTVQTRNTETLRSAATCIAAATYWYSCSRCETISDELYFTYGTPTPCENPNCDTHNPKCDKYPCVCGRTDCNIPHTCNDPNCQICKPNSIRDRQISDNRFGIVLENAIVAETAKISVITPEPATINLRILDNLGNVVFSADDVGAGFARPENRTNGDLGGQTPPLQNAIVWNLQNQSGRFVANGTYLIVVEAVGISGRRFTYSERIGVNR